LNLAKRGVAEEAEMGEEQLMVLKFFCCIFVFLVNINVKIILQGV
jgi:hypothetical protein